MVVGSTSNAQTYTVEGTNLTTDINVSAPSGFEISLDDATYIGTLTLSPSSGTVSQTTIYVQFAPVAEQAYSGNISHENTDATTVNLAVSGNSITISIKNITSEIINIYPNPVNDKLFIENKHGNELQIEIYDITGKLVKNAILTGKNGEIDMQSLESSIYLLKITIQSENRIIKIIKN